MLVFWPYGRPEVRAAPGGGRSELLEKTQTPAQGGADEGWQPTPPLTGIVRWFRLAWHYCEGVLLMSNLRAQNRQPKQYRAYVTHEPQLRVRVRSGSRRV